ncbi:MAG: DUF4114 domain-containing protein [Acidobacteria bacterium]|nr:DUF4114 domain-containing protein [Acidobacteriota bacterium]
MGQRLGRWVPLVILGLLLSSNALADTVVGDGSFQSGWSASNNGSTFFNNASWDGSNLNIGFCVAGGGNCNYSGQPGTTLPVFAGTNFSAPGSFYISPSGMANASLLLEVAGMANQNEFGWFLIGSDPTNAANRHVIFSGPQGAGSASNFAPSGDYGFYMLAGGSTLYTSSLFGGATEQHFAVFQDGNSLWIGIEDLGLQSGDKDYNDMVVRVTAVPEPSSIAFLGMGLCAIAAGVRKRFAAQA